MFLVSGQQVFRRRNYCLVFIRDSANDTIQEQATGIIIIIIIINGTVTLPQAEVPTE
jgi:hypothetical protein